jgi:hypothetical protein
MRTNLILGSSHVTRTNEHATCDYIISESFSHEPKVEIIQYVPNTVITGALLVKYLSQHRTYASTFL